MWSLHCVCIPRLLIAGPAFGPGLRRRDDPRGSKHGGAPPDRCDGGPQPSPGLPRRPSGFVPQFFRSRFIHIQRSGEGGPEMMLATAPGHTRLDELAVKEHGLTIPELMESAGGAVVRVLEVIGPDLGDKRVGILCGKGNNGGDGLVSARLLKQKKSQRGGGAFGKGGRPFGGGPEAISKSQGGESSHPSPGGFGWLETRPGGFGGMRSLGGRLVRDGPFPAHRRRRAGTGSNGEKNGETRRGGGYPFRALSRFGRPQW